MASDELNHGSLPSWQQNINLPRAALFAQHDSPLLKRLIEGHNDSTDSDLSLDDVAVDAPEACPSFWKPAVETPKARPLDLADDFEVVNGVPTFTWEDTLHWRPFHVMAVSSDQTKMALAKKEKKICIYDLLDNFALIAESEKCFKRVNCVAFPRGRNDLVIVVHENSTISSFSIPMPSMEGDSQRNVYILPQKLQVMEQNHMLPRNVFRPNVAFLIACHIHESWVFASDPHTLDELNLFLVSKQDCPRVKILTNERARPRATFISIPYRVVMRVVESEVNNTTRETWIWKGIDFKTKVIDRKPIEIEGQGMGFSDCGKYFLVWNGHRTQQSVLGLYDIESLEGDFLQPLSSTLLPADILDLKVKYFDRDSIEFNYVDLVCDKSIPIIAFLMTHKNNVSLFFWDPQKNEILKQMDLQTSSIVCSPYAELQFCLSPNLKWIALTGSSKNRIGLFSSESKRLIWEGALLNEDLARWPYSAFQFDASSTKLIVNCSEKLYAFAPPCLIEDYKIEMCGAKYELSADNSSLLAPLTWGHQRLLSKDLLKRLMLAQSGLHANDYIDSFDAALSKISPSIALLMSKISPPLLFVGSLDDFPNTTLRAFFPVDDNSVVGLRKMFEEDVSGVFDQLEVSREDPLVIVFLYPDPDRKEDLVVILALNKGLSAKFKDSSITWTQPISFSSEKCLQIRQSDDGHRIICVMLHGVMMIDLNRREPVHVANNKGHIFRDWIRNYARRRLVDLSGLDDRWTVALVDVDTNRHTVLYARKNADDLFVADTPKESKRLFPCTFHIGYSHVAYIDITESKKSPTELGLMNSTRLTSKKNSHRRITNDQWNPHIKKMMSSLFSSNVKDYTMEFDDMSGHLWLIGITEEEEKSNLVFIPFGPFSLESCVPCLHMIDYPARSFTMTELERMADNFGASFFTMTFNSKSNRGVALEEGDVNMACKISHVACNHEVVLSNERQEDFRQSQGNSLLELAIEEDDYTWVKTCLDLTLKHTSPSECASVIRNCFPKLWTKFRSLAISLFDEDKLVTAICDLEIYDNVLNVESYLKARVGTCQSTEDWVEALYRGFSFSHWRSRYENHAIKIERRGTPTKTKATLKVFYMDNVCKTGLKGILRFLLMHNAPSYIFRSSLIKWVIVFKWEMIWRRRSIRDFFVYLGYVSSFSVYAICIGYCKESLKNDHVAWCLFIPLFITCLITLCMAYKEVIQLITCCDDGKELFDNRLDGVRTYFSSPWNVLEVMSYIMLLVVLCLHFVCRFWTLSALPFLLTLSALELLMMWMKIWYYLQPFKKTGALVLLVENVICDCVPFLMLTLAVSIGFGFAMFLAFQNLLNQIYSKDNGKIDSETKKSIDQDFGDPVESILTLFYAMVGMFDPTFFFDCDWWRIFVIGIFVLYLSIQMILMLNMLIALMGDTFDRVKSTEEEQLLLGRARFIDACEAQLTRKQIENIEKNVDKWLYVIFPKDEEESDDIKLWQGRVKTIEDKLERTISNSQHAIISEMKAEFTSKVTSLHKEIETLKRDVRMINNLSER